MRRGEVRRCPRRPTAVTRRTGSPESETRGWRGGWGWQIGSPLRAQSRSGAFWVARWPRRVERPLGGSEAWTPAGADYTNSEASGTYMVLKPVGPGDPGSKRRYGSTGALLVKASETEWGAFQYETGLLCLQHQEPCTASVYSLFLLFSKCSSASGPGASPGTEASLHRLSFPTPSPRL